MIRAFLKQDILNMSLLTIKGIIKEKDTLSRFLQVDTILDSKLNSLMKKGNILSTGVLINY